MVYQVAATYSGQRPACTRTRQPQAERSSPRMTTSQTGTL